MLYMGGSKVWRIASAAIVRRSACGFIPCALVLVAPLASAQQASAPIVTPVHADEGVGELGALRSPAAFMPLRLSLTQGLFPQGPVFLGCDSHEDASGNSVNGFALQRYSFVRLAPRLVLHGFSSAGCAVDAGLGGGLTYELPLTKTTSLVSSLGFYTLPPLDNARSAVISTAGRVDLVKKLGWGRTLSLGLGTRERSGSAAFNAVNFGGSF